MRFKFNKSVLINISRGKFILVLFGPLCVQTLGLEQKTHPQLHLANAEGLLPTQPRKKFGQVGIGLPEMLNLRGGYRFNPNGEVFAQLGGTFIPFQAGKGQISILSFETGILGSPLASYGKPWLKLGLSLGYRRISATLNFDTLQIPSGAVTPPMSFIFNALYLKPLFGICWKTTDKWTLGSEVGIQIPLWALGQVTQGTEGLTATGTLGAVDQIAVTKLASLVVPQLTFLSFQYLF